MAPPSKCTPPGLRRKHIRSRVERDGLGDGTLTAAQIARVVAADVRLSDIVYADGDERLGMVCVSATPTPTATIFDSSLENVSTRRIANITAAQSCEKLNVWRSSTHAKWKLKNILSLSLSPTLS